MGESYEYTTSSSNIWDSVSAVGGDFFTGLFQLIGGQPVGGATPITNNYTTTSNTTNYILYGALAIMLIIIIILAIKASK